MLAMYYYHGQQNNIINECLMRL